MCVVMKSTLQLVQAAKNSSNQVMGSIRSPPAAAAGLLICILLLAAAKACICGHNAAAAEGDIFDSDEKLGSLNVSKYLEAV